MDRTAVARELLVLAREMTAKPTPDDKAKKALGKLTSLMPREWEKAVKSSKKEFAAEMSAELRDILDDVSDGEYKEVKKLIVELLKTTKVSGIDDDIVKDILSMFKQP